MKRDWKYTVLVIAVLTALGLTGCGQQTQQAEQPQLVKAIQVGSEKAARRPVPIRGRSRADTRVICHSRPAAALRPATCSSAPRSMPETS